MAVLPDSERRISPGSVTRVTSRSVRAKQNQVQLIGQVLFREEINRETLMEFYGTLVDHDVYSADPC